MAVPLRPELREDVLQAAGLLLHRRTHPDHVRLHAAHRRAQRVHLLLQRRTALAGARKPPIPQLG